MRRTRTCRHSRPVPVLEKIFQRELHDARIACRENLSEVLAVQSQNRIVWIQMVRHIECFGPELYRLPLRHSEFSRQAHVEGDESRSLNVLGSVAPYSVRRTRKGCRVQPAIDAFIG